MKATRQTLPWAQKAGPTLSAVALGVALAIVLLSFCTFGPESRAASVPVNAPPPVPELLRPDDGVWNNHSNIEFAWSDEKAQSYELHVGELMTTTTETSKVLSLEDGVYTWTVQAWRGGAGSGFAAPWTVQVDAEPPLATIVAPAHGAVLTKTHLLTVTISGTASDATAGLDRVEVHTGTAWKPASGTDNWTYAWALPYVDNLAETLKARSFDGAGNESAVYTVPVMLDTIAPTCSAPTPHPRPYVTSTVAYDWPPASDGSGILRYQVQITSTGGYASVFDAESAQYTFTQATQEQKRYYARVRAVDGQGNWGNWSGPSAMVIADLTPPTVDAPSIVVDNSPYLHAVSTTLYYTNEMIFAQSFKVRGYSEDALSGVVRVCFSAALGDQPACEAVSFQPWQATYTVDPGTTESGAIVATIVDEAGNAAQQAFSYQIDGTPPESSVSTLPAYVTSNPFVVPWTASDAQSGVHSADLWFKVGASGPWTYWDTLPVETHSFQFYPPGDLTGTYCFATVARDNLGNQEPWTGQVDACTVYDKSKPSSEVTWAPENWNQGDAPITMTWAATPTLAPLVEVRLWVRYNEGAWTPTAISHEGLSTDPISGTFSFGPPQDDGRYDWSTVARDDKGESEAQPYDIGDRTTWYDRAIDPPAGLKCVPATWSRTNPFALRWDNPTDLTGIAAAYYRVGATPPISPENGIRVASTGLEQIDGIMLGLEGLRTMWVWLEDQAGNVDPTRAVTTACKYDASVGAPSGLASVPSGWTATNNFGVTWANPPEWSGIAGAYYKPGGGPPTGPENGIWEPGPGLDRIDGLSVSGEGAHTLYLWLRDVAGNNGYANRRTVSLYYDPTPPTEASISAPARTAWTSFVASWSADAAASGLLHYTVEYSGGLASGWQTWLPATTETWGLFTAPLLDTAYDLRLTAYDRAGNSAQAQTSVYVEHPRVYLPLLSCQFSSYEPNDSFDLAYGPVQVGETIVDCLCDAQDVYDYYYFTTLSSSTITIRLTGILPDKDYDLYVYHKVGAQYPILTESVNGTGSDEQVSFVPTPGTKYWILVYSYQGTDPPAPPNNYSLEPYTLSLSQ